MDDYLTAYRELISRLTGQADFAGTGEARPPARLRA